jgi:hypothetical protein
MISYLGIISENVLIVRLMPKKYIVDLTELEQQSLKKLTTTGKHSAYKINHARILLLASVSSSDGGWSDETISTNLGLSVSTVERVRRRFIEEGVDAALSYRAPVVDVNSNA